MWTLHVLGPVRLVAADGSEVARLGTKTEAVLAYLAMRGEQPCSRRALMDLLWPDRSEDEARNALRQWLFDFRRRFSSDCPVHSDGGLLRIDAAACDTDLSRFQRLARSEDPQDWLAACEAFGGDLADRLAVTIDFDRWLMGNREVVRALALELLARMAQRGPHGAAVTAAYKLARVLIAGDPLDEGAYRALMSIHEAAGQRAKAMETWLECRRVLMAGVGAQPSDDTAALHRRIQEGQAPSVEAPAILPRYHAPPPLLPGSDDAGVAAADYMRQAGELIASILLSEKIAVSARQALLSAIALCPHDAVPRRMLARAHYLEFLFGWNGHPAAHYRASAGITEALRRHFPEDPMVVGAAARLAIWRGEHGLAETEVRGAVRRADNPWLLLVLAETLLYAGRHAEAIAVARRAQEMPGAYVSWLRNVVGMACFGQRDLDGALHSLSSALRYSPRHCVAWATLAAVHVERGDIDAARASAESARGENRRYSLAFARDVMPFADQAVRDRWVKAWAAAGMPEREGTKLDAEVEWVVDPSRAATHPVFNALVAPVS
jgi:DNA-binding SARP family transcriptional activator